jgi:hypothetical protein
MNMNMRSPIKVLVTLAFLAIALTVTVMPAAAQLNSNTGVVTINANLPESLTVNLTNPTITITLAENTAVNNSTAPAAGTAIQTAWVLQPGRTAVKVFVYSTVANPLTNGTDTIPATSILISNTGQGGAYSALAAGTPFGTGLQIGASTAITGANKASSRTDTIFFQINTTFNPQLSAGLYTGTLNVQAQATP